MCGVVLTGCDSREEWGDGSNVGFASNSWSGSPTGPGHTWRRVELVPQLRRSSRILRREFGRIARRITDAGVNIDLFYLTADARFVVGVDDLDAAQTAL